MRTTYTGTDLLGQLLLQKDALLTSIRREDIALDAFLRREARRPDHHPVFRYVLRHYIGLVNPNLTEEFEQTFFYLFQAAARQPDKRNIVGLTEALYEVKNRRGNPSMQFPQVTHMLHLLNVHYPIYDPARTAFLGMPSANHLSGFDKKMTRYIEQYSQLFECYQSILTDSRFESLTAAFDEYFQDPGYEAPSRAKKLDLLMQALSQTS
ncbi:hypothetical protein SAMN05421663_101251 [Terribacillus halophilus]|uniref:Uncharacterized protein n=1 Tax=Terribacillus halophilus TaxID=361279 RepID=A0A1G6IE64_9BACI|nr:hypothetical protein [Terribacillus halophilus]SDC04771.1 hypothetical protein SAMN05421663_101251 [Terribacillus halophilus]